MDRGKLKPNGAVEIDRPYTLRELAEATGLHYQSLWRMVKRGELPASRLGSRLLVPAAVVVQILAGKWPGQSREKKERE